MPHPQKNGFSLIEVLIVMAVFIFFIGMVTINVLNIEPRSSLNSGTSTLIADLRKQQLKSMTGNSYNGQNSEFGVHLETNQYTLFPGNTYTQGAAANSIITLSDNITITNIAFAGSNIVFNKNTGEINNFVNGSNTFRIRNSIANEEKTITFNKLGVVTGAE